MATEPINPYAPSAALAQEAEKPVARGPGRLAALVLGILAYPLTGAGFYALGRPRRLVRWVAAGLILWVLTIVSVRFQLPKLCVFAFTAMMIATVASLVDLLVAGPLAPPKGRALLIAALLVVTGRGGAFAVKRWLAEAFSIPSGAMIPSLLIGDHIMVSKGRGDVQRGDIVVFEFPLDRSTDYAKRVVAIGGDTIEVREGIVSINGAALEQTKLEGDCPEQEEPGWCELARETNAGRSYTIMRTPGHPAQDLPRTTLPEDHVFVLGDNRDNSYDSRKWGPVPLDHVKGKATLVYMSSDPKTHALRWSRVGRGVE
jgi:signal peptidase I